MGLFLDAAEIVLRRAGKPLRLRELGEEALAAKLLEESDGKTPLQTMKAKLSVNIKQLGTASRFKRVGKGLFALREFDDPEYVAKPFEKRIQPKDDVLVVPAALLKKVGWFHGVRTDYERYYETLLNPNNTRVISRIEAETNPAFKQIISYVLIRKAGAILRFRRGSYSSVQAFLTDSATRRSSDEVIFSLESRRT